MESRMYRFVQSTVLSISIEIVSNSSSQNSILRTAEETFYEEISNPVKIFRIQRWKKNWYFLQGYGSWLWLMANYNKDH